jgi:hypothetical protein
MKDHCTFYSLVAGVSLVGLHAAWRKVRNRSITDLHDMFEIVLATWVLGKAVMLAIFMYNFDPIDPTMFGEEERAMCFLGALGCAAMACFTIYKRFTKK